MKEMLSELNFFERILANVFRDYTYTIYRKGIRDGFNYYQSKGCNKAEKIKIK